MRNGISGKPIPAHLPFAKEITNACALYDFPPCLAYAIRQNETDSSTDPAEMQIGSIGDYMPDGSNAGHGIFQLTSSWPYDWDDPYANTTYALEVFLLPAFTFWTAATTLEGDALVKVIADSFNEGTGAAYAAHLKGNADAGTTDKYGARAVAAYHKLIA